MQKSDLPFGSEFSPSQIDLRTVLRFAEQYGGDWKEFENAVYYEYFVHHKGTNEYNQRKLANNCKLGMIAYGIIDRDANLTDFGVELLEVADNEPELYDRLARFILVNLHGLNVINTTRDARYRGEAVDLIRLRELLEERGIHFPRGGKHPSIMRLWLEKAGVVVSTDWRVNETKLDELLGYSTEEIDALVGMTLEQKSFLKAMANLTTDESRWSNDIEKLANLTYGVKFNEKNLPKTVLYPLEQAGFITLQRGTREPGHGAKAFLVTPTEKMKSEIFVPLLEGLEKDVHAHLRPFLRKPLREIVDELDSEDKYVKGLALEALGFHLMRMIDLTYVATRLRGSSTGGAEVDLIFESWRLSFSRWQIQCKNTATVSLDDVAKEVGLTFQLKSNVVAFITTGSIGSEARKYARTVMDSSNLSLIFISGEDIRLLLDNPTKIIDVLNREARIAMRIKSLEPQQEQ